MLVELAAVNCPQADQRVDTELVQARRLCLVSLDGAPSLGHGLQRPREESRWQAACGGEDVTHVGPGDDAVMQQVLRQHAMLPPGPGVAELPHRVGLRLGHEVEVSQLRRLPPKNAV